MSSPVATAVQQWKDHVKAGVDSLLEENGCRNPDGSRALSKLDDTVVAHLTAKSVARTKRERPTKATTKGTLPALVLETGWVSADEVADQKDPALAEAVRKEAERIVWGRVAIRGPVQRRIGYYDDGTFVLVQTRIGNDLTPAVYITNDLQSIREDLMGTMSRKSMKIADDYAELVVLLIQRQGYAAGRKFEADYNMGLSNALNSGAGNIKLALQAANGSPNGNPDGAPDADDEDDGE